MWRVHICYYPAIGAAGILPVKFGYILEGSFEAIKKYISVNKSRKIRILGQKLHLS